jgi:hypothetical protein
MVLIVAFGVKQSAIVSHNDQPYVRRLLITRDPMLTDLRAELKPDCSGQLPAPNGRTGRERVPRGCRRGLQRRRPPGRPHQARTGVSSTSDDKRHVLIGPSTTTRSVSDAATQIGSGSLVVTPDRSCDAVVLPAGVVSEVDGDARKVYIARRLEEIARAAGLHRDSSGEKSRGDLSDYYGGCHWAAPADAVSSETRTDAADHE